MGRYIGVHRAEDKINTDDIEKAIAWLKILSSIAATLTDTHTGQSWRMNASGEIVPISIDTLASKGKAAITPRRPQLRTTRTYAILEVSKEAYDEITKRLQAAGYTHAFQQTDSGTVIDMDGIALQQEPVSG